MRPGRVTEHARERLAGRIGLAAAALACSLAFVAEAHVGHVILRAERYLKLDATEADTRLVVSLTMGPDEGRRVLESADTSADGDVSLAESEAYLAQWAIGLRDELPVEIDGERASLEWTDGWMEPIGAVARTPLTLELVAHLPTHGREHVIRFRDAMVRREVYDRTDVAFRGHEGAELVRSGIGESPTGVEEDLGLSGAEGAEVFTAEVRYPTRSWISMLPRAVWGGVLAAAVLGAVAAVLGRRRTARSGSGAPSGASSAGTGER